MLHLRGDGGQDFADLHALGPGLDRLEFATVGRSWLEVPQVHVTWTPAHPHDDETLVLFLQLWFGSSHSLHELKAWHSHRRETNHVLEKMPSVAPHEGARIVCCHGRTPPGLNIYAIVTLLSMPHRRETVKNLLPQLQL